MDENLFEKLIESASQAAEIARGERNPSRTFEVTSGERNPSRTFEVTSDIVHRARNPREHQFVPGEIRRSLSYIGRHTPKLGTRATPT